MGRNVTIPTEVRLEKDLAVAAVAIARATDSIAEDESRLREDGLEGRAHYVVLSGRLSSAIGYAFNAAYLMGFGRLDVGGVVSAAARVAAFAAEAFHAHTAVGWGDMRPEMGLFEWPWIGRCPSVILDYQFPERPVPTAAGVGMEDVYPNYWTARARCDVRSAQYHGDPRLAAAHRQ